MARKIGLSAVMPLTRGRVLNPSRGGRSFYVDEKRRPVYTEVSMNVGDPEVFYRGDDEKNT